MVQKVGGFRRKSRKKLTKHRTERGKISISKYFQEFKVGERVQLLAEPAVQKGMFFPKFYGKTGLINGKRGNCYKIVINDYGKKKIVITHPVHLKRVL